ncbi:DUF4142 domain-containing protein [Sphingomonas mesophila]|uniref:DUF4142 domain-containing protein n=1 Tax=Sphingomonas mesophila TaxID=2303576 RepID=UPI000E57BDFC|nr:DUF4142 domain-containing protein [Sphingomonas mesophila]
MNRRAIRWAALGATVLMMAGCSSGPAPAPRSSAPFVLPSAAAALTPAVYMQLASSASLFAVRASELAAERARSGAVRSAAQSIVRDQTGVAAQLSFAGRRLELLPSAVLGSAEAAELDRLRASGDFDSDYRRAVAAALARALDAHQTFARSGPSPTLRPVAQMAAPVTRRNLDSLRR